MRLRILRFRFYVCLFAGLTTGVSHGAETEMHWSFRPVTNPTSPAVRNAGWPRSEVDRFILATLEEKGLPPVADADRETLLRRLTFTLIGLPPTPEQIEAFVAGGEVETTVDELIASPRFGEKWARHWLDLARYAETNGKDRNVVLSHAWRYRDWTIDALNRDLPYNQFVREQIAGDLMPEGGDASLVATGFLTLGPKAFQEVEKEKFVMDLVDEQIDVMSRAILGLTMACARCHDHKFDPIPTADYYALAGILLSSESLYGVGPLYFEKHYYDTMVAPIGPDGMRLDARVQAWRGEIYTLNQKAIELRSAAYKIKRSVTGTLRDRGLKKPEEDPGLAAETAKSDAMYEEAKEALAKRDQLLAAPPVQPAYAMAMREGAAPEDCRIRTRGEFNQSGHAVPRGRLNIPGMPSLGKIATDESGRKQLAEWLASPENPMTARVMVNRVWHHLFGRGLVRTVDNFGVMGEAPTHPELLDHLAWVFVHEDGWSVKRLIRRIVLTRTWQLESSGASDRALEIDPDNTLLWRANFRRLEVEAFRDAVLAVSGGLDPEPPKGGSMLAGTFLGHEYGEGGDKINVSVEMAADRHRTIYLPIVRNDLAEILGLFDFADTHAATGARNARTIPSQSLYLMNGDFIESQARAAAIRLSPKEDAAALDLAARLTQGRAFSDEVKANLSEYLDHRRSEWIGAGKPAGEAAIEAWTDVFQTLFSATTFRYLN